MSEELANGRDFNAYATSMDGSLAMKIAEIMPHVLPGTIVDAGYGTGALLDLLVRRFPDNAVVGIEASREFTLRAFRRFRDNPHVRLVRGDAASLTQFGCQNASTVIFSSVLHEVHSYHGYDQTPVKTALSNARLTLRPGGRVIIRDGIAPNRATVSLWTNDADGDDAGRVERLSTRALFRRFASEFRHGIGVPFEESIHNTRLLFELTARDAYEFINKKDYRPHWDLEAQEEYGFWRRREWEVALRDAGFRILRFDEILNPWIAEHRFSGHVELFEPGTSEPLPYFPTHCVIVGERAE